MRNKKRILTLSVMLIIVVLFILPNMGVTSSTTAIVTVLKKNYIEEQEEDQTYLVHYDNKQSGVSILTHIENIDDKHAIQLQ